MCDMGGLDLPLTAAFVDWRLKITFCHRCKYSSVAFEVVILPCLQAHKYKED